MRFRKRRLQRFEVGVNVGNDEKLHADHHHTKLTGFPIGSIMKAGVGVRLLNDTKDDYKRTYH